MVTREKFAQFLSSLRVILPEHAPNTDQSLVQDLWYDALGNNDIEVLRRVYSMCRERLSRFPSIKQINDLIEEIAIPIPRDPFKEIMDNIRRYGKHGSKWPTQDDMIGRLLHRTGTIERYANLTDVNTEWVRKEVNQVWKELMCNKRLGYYDNDKIPSSMCGVRIERCSYEEALTGTLSHDKLALPPPPQSPEQDIPLEYFRGGKTEEFKSKWQKLKEEIANMKPPPSKVMTEEKRKEIENAVEIYVSSEQQKNKEFWEANKENPVYRDQYLRISRVYQGWS